MLKFVLEEYNMEMGTRYCLQCGKKINTNDKKCPFCGENQYENDLYLSKMGKKIKKRKRRGFEDEEILALGLYPKGECYKMSLISRILGRRKS